MGAFTAGTRSRCASETCTVRDKIHTEKRAWSRFSAGESSMIARLQFLGMGAGSIFIRRSGEDVRLVRSRDDGGLALSNFLLLLLAQGIPSSPIELVTNSTGATKIVLGILVILSLISWGIIFAKWYELRKALRITYSFAHEFAGAHTVERAAQMARTTGGPPATIMQRAMRFIEETKPALSGTSER